MRSFLEGSPWRLLRLIGDYWNRLFPDREQLGNWIRALQLAYRRVVRELEEARALAYWPRAPYAQHREYHVLRLNASEMNVEPAAIARYGELQWTHGTVGGEDWLRYGRAWGWDRYIFPAPADLRRIRLLSDRLRNPTISWSEGTDFRLEPDRQRLVFFRNPFAEAKAETVLRPDGRLDQTLELWAVHTTWDRRYLQEHWGAMAQRERSTSEGYCQAIRSWWHLAALGVSHWNLKRHLADLLDVPATRYVGEKLLEVFQERGCRVLVTTHRRYLARADAEVAVPLGEPLPAGSWLTKSLEWFDLHRGELPSLPILYVMPEWMSFPLTAPLGFPNRLVPVRVRLGTWTKVSWELEGPDVERFWEEVHLRGVARQQTLAHLLDRRSRPEGEPESQHLPARINPMEFLVRNVLRQAIVLRVRWQQRGPRAQPAADLSAAVRLVQPHTMVIVVLELTAPAEIVTMRPAGDFIEHWDGMRPLSEDWPQPGSSDSSRGYHLD